MIGVIIIMENNLRFYQEHDIMTEIKTMEDMVTNIPKDIKTIISYVQNILLHQHWSEVYGVKLSESKYRHRNMDDIEYYYYNEDELVADLYIPISNY